MDERTGQLLKFLGQASMQFKRSEVAYANYMRDGRKFIHARILKACNDELRSLLLKYGHLLSEPLRDDAVTLIAHYDIWIERWNALEQRQHVALDDAFVFENEHRFPKEAAQRLERAFENTREDAGHPPINK